MADERQKKAYRLLAAIYPTRRERLLGWFVTFAYHHAPSESGPLDWLGNRADDLRCNLAKRRADRGRWNRGKWSIKVPNQ